MYVDVERKMTAKADRCPARRQGKDKFVLPGFIGWDLSKILRDH